LQFGTAIEFSERVSYFSIASNLISYLTKVMHEDLSTASKNVNYWSGTTTLMPLVGGFVADAYTGRFYMVLFSSFVYLMVNQSTFPPYSLLYIFYYNFVTYPFTHIISIV